MNGIITLGGDLTDFLLVGRRPSGVMRIRCAAEPGPYSDLGEGIHQTLHGTCTVGVGGAVLPAALEYRVT